MNIIQRSLGHVVRQIQPGLWQITFHFPASTNCWLWQEPDGLTLIDAAHPWNAAAILAAVQLLGQPLRRIVITHAHPDHAGAAAELSERTSAEVYVHESEKDILAGRACMADAPGFWPCRAILKTGRWLGVVNPPPVERITALVDGQEIGRLVVVHTPGHTPGSISLWCRPAQAIFCGDNLVSSFDILHLGLPWFTLDAETRAQSLERYAPLPASLLLSGHGPVYRRENAVAEVLRLIRHN